MIDFYTIQWYNQCPVSCAALCECERLPRLSKSVSKVKFSFMGLSPNSQGCYETYQTLVIKEQISVPSSCVPVWDGSITDLVKNHSIPQEKIVVGKIVSQYVWRKLVAIQYGFYM